METSIFLTVALIWTIAAITPGPNFFISIHTAIGESRRLSFFTVTGIVAGTFIWSLSSYLGITLLLQAVPVLYSSLKIIGGIYLVYRGFLLLTRNKDHYSQPKNGRSASARGCFKLGLFTNLLNPKTAAFITSIFATAIPASASLTSGIICIALICAISAVWYSLVALLFSGTRAKKIYDRNTKSFQRLAGSVFIVFGFRLALSK